MGLFDWVRVEVPIDGLPAGVSIEWQTKDFDCPYMERYKITPEGRLMKSIYHTEDRSDPNAGPGSAASFAGCMTHVHDEWRDMNYHGDLDLCGEVDGTYPHYIARFTEGQLVRIAPEGATEVQPSSPKTTTAPEKDAGTVDREG